MSLNLIGQMIKKASPAPTPHHQRSRALKIAPGKRTQQYDTRMEAPYAANRATTHHIDAELNRDIALVRSTSRLNDPSTNRAVSSE